MPVNEIRQDQPPEAIPCLENTIPSRGVLSQFASAKDPIPDTQFNEFLRYFRDISEVRHILEVIVRVFEYTA